VFDVIFISKFFHFGKFVIIFYFYKSNIFVKILKFVYVKDDYKLTFFT